MSPIFDAYVMVDWSAAAIPVSGAHSLWIAATERADDGLTKPRLINPPTRREAVAFLSDLLVDFVARDRTVLVGFDFAFGYPVGFAQKLGDEGADWRAVWSELAARIRDDENNANNRFTVASALNDRISGGAFPFWGCSPHAAGAMLSTRKPAGFANATSNGLVEYRLCDRMAGAPHPVWKLAYPGCVGSQTLVGIPHLHALRGHPCLAERVLVWPFETGLAQLQHSADRRSRVVLAEIYPSIFDQPAVAHAVKDARQVYAVVEQLGRLDDGNRLAPLFAGPTSLSSEQRRAVESEEGWILGVETAAPVQVAAAPSAYTYVRDPEEIYRRSFATIRSEADLGAVPANLEPLLVRMIHAAGDPGVVADIVWTPDAAAAGRRALAAGAPILVDTEMVAAGIIRHRLPAANDVRCTLRGRGVAEAARKAATTRSAAALDRWRGRLNGAVVAIGNAPTALFRLLELLDEGAPKPALILGFPVGFVGAAEAKEALIAHPGGVPYVTLRGRRGGSAFAAAAVNALAGPPA